MIGWSMIQYGFFFRSVPFYNEYRSMFTKYTFQTIKVFSVFKILFKLIGSIRGSFFSPVFETQDAVYSSAFGTVTIIKSHWLPFRLSDYKSCQFPTNVILRAEDLVHYSFVTYIAIVMGVYQGTRLKFWCICAAHLQKVGAVKITKNGGTKILECLKTVAENYVIQNV